MTRHECLKLMSVLQAAYPHAYRGYTKEQADTTVDLWMMAFERDDYAEVDKAVRAFISSDPSNWPPPVGKVRQIMMARRPQTGRSDLEAWSLVRKALRNGNYGAEEEYKKLPADIQRAVGSADQLRAWAAAPEDETETVMQSNFLRSYRAVKEREATTETYGRDLLEMVRQRQLEGENNV